MSTTLTPSDILYDKTYECPVCYNKFTSKAIRTGKNQALSSDIDLYARYAVINPILYDAILCPNCGYCSLSKNFSALLPTQIKWIKEQVTPKYKKRNFDTYTSINDAIIKHQLALVSSIIKKGKIGEQAYICLHIAWLYRDLNALNQEKIYLNKAVNGLKQALETENFPLFNLDALTTSYIISAISYTLGDYTNAKTYLSDVLYNSNGKLKDRALNLKEMILEHT